MHLNNIWMFSTARSLSLSFFCSFFLSICVCNVYGVCVPLHIFIIIYTQIYYTIHIIIIFVFFLLFIKDWNQFIKYYDDDDNSSKSEQRRQQKQRSFNNKQEKKILSYVPLLWHWQLLRFRMEWYNGKEEENGFSWFWLSWLRLDSKKKKKPTGAALCAQCVFAMNWTVCTYHYTEHFIYVYNIIICCGISM